MSILFISFTLLMNTLEFWIIKRFKNFGMGFIFSMKRDRALCKERFQKSNHREKTWKH